MLFLCNFWFQPPIYWPLSIPYFRSVSTWPKQFILSHPPIYLPYVPLLFCRPLTSLCQHSLYLHFAWPSLILSPSLLMITLLPPNISGSAVERSPARNIQVFNPTTNTLNVRWEAATGPVQQYRVVYAPLTGARPSESVSFHPLCREKYSIAHTLCAYKEKIFT